MIKWPGNKLFAFTIVDDTDRSSVETVKPVYDLLYQNRIRTTKTVWVYPPRDNYTGQCLEDEDYRNFVQDLVEQGFEIALHNVGSGQFSREEILSGLDKFAALLGHYPKMQINHSNNPDNIYWGYKRFVAPLAWLFRLSAAHTIASGEEENSKLFWGDAHKQHIRYTRNHVFNGINTLSYDTRMPYRVKHKNQYSNFWFSSSDAHTVREFNALTSPKALDLLQKSGGLCIAYTHFNSGYTNQDGELEPDFCSRITDLASRGGWYAPASEILDHLQTQAHRGETASYPQLLKLDIRWAVDRLAKESRIRRQKV